MDIVLLYSVPFWLYPLHFISRENNTHSHSPQDVCPCCSLYLECSSSRLFTWLTASQHSGLNLNVNLLLSFSLQLFLPSFLVIHYYVEFYFLCNTNIRDDLTAYVFIVFPLPLIQSCFESYSADTGTMLRVLPTQLVFNLHLLNK
jgi:hypothetical protein